MVEVPRGKDPANYAYECMNDQDHSCQDKWGPAACIEVKGTRLKDMRSERYKGKRNFHAYYFFGYASE